MLKNEGAQKLEQSLRQSIANGELPPSGRLLSVRELAAQYGLTYGRAHRILKRLEKEGLLISRHGGGTFVSDSPGSAQAATGVSKPGVVVAMPERYWTQDETLWFREFIRGLESALNARGARMTVVHTERYLQQFEELAAARTHILLYSLPDEMMQRLRDDASQRTVLLVAHDTRHADWALTLDIDGAAGMRLGVRALRARGHAGIALLSWEFAATMASQNWWARVREAAYTAAMEQQGLLPRVLQVPHPEPDPMDTTPRATIEARIGALLTGAGRPTALLCVNDLLARLAWGTCEKLGLRVPEDMAILGFDDEPWAVTRGLATFHRPYRELGQMAAEIAAQNQTQARTRWRGVLAIEPELVERASLGTVRG